MTKTAAAIALALALAAGLTACDPAAPTPTAPVTATPTPTATPEPVIEPIAAPQPALDLACSDLVNPATLAGLFTSGVSEADPEQTIIEAANLIPYKYAIEQQGGIACEWSNGQPQSAKVGTNSAYRGTSASIARVSATEWARFADYYGVVGDRQVYCYENCNANLLVAGAWWVEVELQATDAADPLAAFTAEVAGIEAAITAAAASGAIWTAPSGTIPLPADCERILPAASVQSAFALPDALLAVPPAGGVSLDGTIRTQNNSLWCSYLLLDADLGPGTLHRLPGGEWAWNEARTFGLLGGTPVEIDVAGLEEGDSAWVRCPESGACAVDVIVGHNWLQFVAYLDEYPSSADRHVAIEQIAAAIVASVRA
jgi:hypothetical protein